MDDRAVVIRFGDHADDFCKDRVMAAHSCEALPIPAVIERGAADDASTGHHAGSDRGALGSRTAPQGKAVLTLPSTDGKAGYVGYGHRGASCRRRTMPRAGPRWG